jgi:hypothetical protein
LGLKILKRKNIDLLRKKKKYCIVSMIKKINNPMPPKEFRKVHLSMAPE